MGHVGVAGVTTEGALLCVREIATLGERESSGRCRHQITLHAHPMAHYIAAMERGDRAAVAELLLSSIARLRDAGAELAIIPANAPHAAFDLVGPFAAIPTLNLVEEVADECARLGCSRVAILGVLWTMRGGLYDQPLRRRGIEPVVPTDAEQQEIHGIITRELLQFNVTEPSTARLLDIVAGLRSAGCDAVVLACTELPLCLNEANCGMPAIDTTRLLALRALDWLARRSPSGTEVGRAAGPGSGGATVSRPASSR